MRQAIAVQHILISIHALREEGDQVQGALDREPEKFLSTPSARRATLRSVRQDVRNDISIHALREEGDLLWEHFENLMGQFLSTPSARRATTAAFSMTTMSRFLSTPSARRATRRSARGWSACINFYPRPPRGGRQDALDFLFEVLGFLSTPSARRATRFASSVLLSGVISIHALREEGDRMPSTSFSRSSDFYPRPPRGGRRGLPPRCCCRA